MIPPSPVEIDVELLDEVDVLLVVIVVEDVEVLEEEVVGLLVVVVVVTPVPVTTQGGLGG